MCHGITDESRKTYNQTNNQPNNNKKQKQNENINNSKINNWLLTVGSLKLQFSLSFVTSCYVIMNVSIAWNHRQAKDYITRRNEIERKL